jgi:hypothetical protein
MAPKEYFSRSRNSFSLYLHVQQFAGTCVVACERAKQSKRARAHAGGDDSSSYITFAAQVEGERTPTAENSGVGVEAE